jgi:hypothetical protein
MEVLADALLIVKGAVLPPDLARLLRHPAVGLQVFLRDGQDISIYISHENPPLVFR